MSFPYGAVIGNGGVNLTGAWSAVTSYAIKDAAESGGTSYVALAPSTDIEPGVDAGWEDYWMIWAEKGDAGATGATGPTGPAGPDPTNADAGEVWTADGDGDADWAAPSGGGGIQWSIPITIDSGAAAGAGVFFTMPPGVTSASLRVVGWASVSGMGFPAPDVTLAIESGDTTIDSAVVEAVPGMGGHKVFDVTLDAPSNGTFPYASTRFTFKMTATGSDPINVYSQMAVV